MNHAEHYKLNNPNAVSEPVMNEDGHVTSNLRYCGNTTQMVKVLKAMKVRQNSVFVNGYIVRRVSRKEWQIGEYCGDWLTHGNAEEIANRSQQWIFKS